MKLKFFLFFLFLSFISKAQVKITVGQPYGVIDAYNKYYFHKGAEILTVKIKKKEIVIQKLNSDKLSFQKISVSRDLPQGAELERVLEFNNRYFIFYSLWDRQAGMEQLFYKEIDFDKGTIMPGEKLLIQVHGKVTGSLVSRGWYNFSVVNKFAVEFSKNHDKMLIYYRLKPMIKNDNKSYDIIGMHVFGKNLEPVWDEEVTMPYTEKKMDNLDYSVDGQGNAYILTTVYNDERTDDKKNREENELYHIELLKMSGRENKILITPVTLGNKFISNVSLFEVSDSDMIIAGYYNNENNRYAVDGVFTFKLTKDGDLIDSRSYEIPLEILNMYVSERTQRRNEKKAEKNKAEFESLELRELFVDDKGGILLVGEQYYVQSHTYYYSNGTMRTYYTYHYNDLLVTKINEFGQLQWMKKLAKRQTGSSGRGSMSYKHMYSNGAHYFLYLDNERNFELTPDRLPISYSDGSEGVLTAYKIYENSGKVEKIGITNTRDVMGLPVYQFQTSRILPVNQNSFVVEVYKKRKQDVLIRVDLGK